MKGPVKGAAFGRVVAAQVSYRCAASGRALGRWAWGRDRHTTKARWSRRARVTAWSVTGIGAYNLAVSGGAPDPVGFACTLTAAGTLPGLGRAGFALVVPGAYARFDAWTFRRGLAKHVREQWPEVASRCGLAVRQSDGTALTPKVKTRAEVGSVLVTISVLVGQTVRSVLNAGEEIATAYLAHAFEVRPAGPGIVTLRLFLTNGVAAPRTATLPVEETVDEVPAGVRLDGAPFDLRVRGRHTLVVGASGAGKGSAFWAIVGGLAPASAAGLARLWGIDLKKGLEAGMGEALFHATAYNHADALAVLRALVAVIEERGALMRGVSRSFAPRPGDPVHVLVIDELADLMAYADLEVRRDAERLLSVILTQGRALGVCVAAFVQNPRQEAVGMRNLYTQKIALRLDSEIETDMVLDSRASTAPAHMIDPNAPGIGYLVNEDGTTSMVRFDFWPDDLIREAAAAYPAPDRAYLPPVVPHDPIAALRARLDDDSNDGPSDATATETPVRTRKPRAPRKPRASRVAPAAPAAASEHEAGTVEPAETGAGVSS